MIVRDHLPWLRIWPRVSKRLIGLLVFDTTIAALYTFAGWDFVAQPSLPLATMGSALGIFLAFRTNSAYERWWEARILWGALVNWSRSFARQALTFLPSNAGAEARAMQRELVLHTIAFVCAMRCFLRRQNPFPELLGILGPENVRPLRGHLNVPAAVALEMGRRIRQAADNGWIDSYRWVAMDRSLSELLNILGGCERIKNTPLPRQYDVFPRMIVGIYCLMLPFGLVEGMGMLTPIASTVVSFIFLALDTVGREIENPFENTVHDTPMTALSRTIEINLRQQLGDRSAPPPLQPVDGFVY